MEKSEERWWSAELHRLRGVLLAALGAGETEIETSFREAIRIAKGQKSVSLEKRAEGTYAEYRRQKASATGGRDSDCLFANFFQLAAARRPDHPTLLNAGFHSAAQAEFVCHDPDEDLHPVTNITRCGVSGILKMLLPTTVGKRLSSS